MTPTSQIFKAVICKLLRIETGRRRDSNWLDIQSCLVMCKDRDWTDIKTIVMCNLARLGIKVQHTLVHSTWYIRPGTSTFLHFLWCVHLSAFPFSDAFAILNSL